MHIHLLSVFCAQVTDQSEMSMATMQSIINNSVPREQFDRLELELLQGQTKIKDVCLTKHFLLFVTVTSLFSITRVFMTLLYSTGRKFNDRFGN